MVVACACGTKLKVAARSAGKQVQCPTCQRRLKIKSSAVPNTSSAQDSSAAAGVSFASTGADAFAANPPAEDPFASNSSVGAPTSPATEPDLFADAPAAPGESVAWDELPSSPAGPAFPSAPAADFPSPSAMPTPAASPSAFPAAQAPTSPSPGQLSREDAALAAAGGYSPSIEERQASVGDGDGGFEFNRFHLGLIVMFFLGPAMCFFGFKEMAHRSHIKATGVATVGIITDGWEKRGRKGRRSYHLKVTWQSEGGSEYNGTFDVSSSYYDEVFLDMPIPVQYDTENPGDCILLDDRDNSMVTVMLGAAIFLVSIGGIGWTIYSEVA